MAYEDFWWEIDADITKLGLRKKFAAQLKKMKHQDKHKYKDTRDLWEYAYNKVLELKKDNKK